MWLKSRTGWTVVALAALTISSALAVEKAAPKVRVRGVLSPPQVGSPINLRIAVYPAELDSFGKYVVPKGGVEKRFVYFDPKSMGRPQDFQVELEMDREYEMRVDVLDANGDPIKDKTYYFADITQDIPEGQTSLRNDDVVPVPLAFRVATRLPNRGNFISPGPGKAGGFVLTHYINEQNVPED